jgi:hypothetical protein
MGVPQGPLNGFVGDTKPVKIRRQSSTKGMPAVPGNSRVCGERNYDIGR